MVKYIQQPRLPNYYILHESPEGKTFETHHRRRLKTYFMKSGKTIAARKMITIVVPSHYCIPAGMRRPRRRRLMCAKWARMNWHFVKYIVYRHAISRSWHLHFIRVIHSTLHTLSVSISSREKVYSLGWLNLFNRRWYS